MTARTCGMLLAVLVCISGVASGETVWSIGQVDDSYNEFAISGKYLEYPTGFPNDTVFVEGRDKAVEKWPYIHPGPADAWAGSRKHTFGIQFDLASDPQSAYRLTVKAIDTQNSVPPRLEVKVNDTLTRTLPFEPGTDGGSLSDPKIGRRQSQSLLFAGSSLHKGTNTIALTVVEGSWVLYDAVVLETADVKGPEADAVTAASTPFFRSVGSDLKQAVRVTVHNNGLEGTASLSIADAPDTVQEVRLEQGDNAFQVLVTPYTQAAQGRALIRVADRTTEAAFEGRPARHWKIYVAPSAHTDIGYTDLQEKVFVRQNDNTAAALKACETNPDFKWNLEVFSQADWYRDRGDAAFQELERRIAERRISFTSLYLNMLTGLCSGEELIKVIGPAQEFGRAHNVPVTVATITDVPTVVGTLPMFLKQAGVKYFAEGVNNDRGPIWLYTDKRMYQSPFWWEAFDGSRVMAIFTKSYGQAQVMGLRDGVPTLEEKLPGWLKMVDREDYPGDAVYGNGAFWDNEAVTPHFIDVANEWNKTWAFPQIIVARPDEFFEYVEKNFGEALPVFRGDMGAYWEDGAASSAVETGMVRLAKARLNVASRREALAASRDPKWETPRDEFAKAWKDAIYYDEHTWGAWCSISQPQSEQTVKQWEYKAAYAQRAAKAAVELDRRSAEGALDRLAEPKSDAGRFVTVWNECSWPRDITVAVTGAAPGLGVKAVPSFRQDEKTFFVAKAVPAMGYRCFELTEREGAKEPAGLLRAGADAYTWESPQFRFRINPKTGAFSSIEDLRSHREWIDASSGYGLNQFLYVTGGEGTSLINQGATPAPALQPNSHTEASVRLVANGPFCAVLQISRKGDGVSPIETSCAIHADGRIDFLNTLDKQETTQKEAGYFAFPFRLDAPERTRTLYDLPYGIAEADKEQPAGACRAWYAVNSFMAVTDEHVSAYVATREAPLFTVGTLVDGTWPAKLEKNRGTIFAYVFNNYWHTNYKASQGGPTSFSFSVKLSEGAFDPVTATRFGWECLMSDSEQGMLCKIVKAGKQAQRKHDSLLSLKKGPVMLTELTQEKDGRLLVRLYNPSMDEKSTTIKFPSLRIKRASKTDLFGQKEEPATVAGGKLKASVPGRSIATYTIQTVSR